MGIISVVNSTFGSSLPSGAIEFISIEFRVVDQAQLVLPISLYLVCYVLGPSLWGPTSESYGRQPLMISSFILYTVFTMSCAVAPTWPALLIFRLLCGICASGPIAIVGGLYADIYDDPVTRGRAMALFMGATMLGPIFSPILSGFISPASWRWTFWAGTIIAGISLGILCFLPETYGQAILRKRARRLRREGHKPTCFATIELQKKGVRQLLTVVLARPLRMILTEAIVMTTCLYLSLIYAIFYLFFEAYPLIFQGIYHFSTGETGLAFLAMGVGSISACFIFVAYDNILRRAKVVDRPWSRIEEYRRIPLACLGGVLIVVSLFWLGWSAKPQVHWIVPTMAGTPFAMGFMLIFMALLNYVTDAYEVYAASAVSATSICRSVFGAVLPLAARPMYQRLGIPWASSLLGFASLAMAVIPFAFIRYGARIRARSSFCRELKERKEAAEVEHSEKPEQGEA